MGSKIREFYPDSIHLPHILQLTQTIFAVTHDWELMCFTDFFSNYESESDRNLLIHQTPLILLPCKVKSPKNYESDYIKFVWEGVIREIAFAPFRYPYNTYILALLT